MIRPRHTAALVLATLLCAEAAAAERARPYTRNVAIVLYEGAEVLDFAGPAEVFQAAASLASHGEEPAFRVYTMARSAAPITSQHLVKIIPEYTIENAPPPDIIVIPGGNSGVLLDDPAFMRWAKGGTERAQVLLTVCTGAFVPARLGLLDGLTVTTWYGAVARLQREAPRARVVDGRRFVDNGRIVTTAGVSAGIDGALHVVARLLGKVNAEQTARYMEYRWAPEPYLAGAYPLLNPSLDDRGRADEQAGLLREEKASRSPGR